MLDIEDLLDSEKMRQEAYDHYSLGKFEDDTAHPIFISDSKDFAKFVCSLLATSKLAKRFQAVIHYDPEYKASIIRIQSDRDP